MKRALGLSLLLALDATLMPAAATVVARQSTQATVHSPFEQATKSKLTHLHHRVAIKRAWM